MPLPPVHGLVALLPYFKAKSVFDPLALVASAICVDLECPIYFFMGQQLDHQIWHGYALALTVYPLIVGLVVYSAEHLFENRLWSAYNKIGFKPTRVKYPPLNIYLCCLVGSFSHIFFDMFTHESMPYVIYPLTYGNPFYLGQASGIVEIITITLTILSVYLWWKNTKTPNTTTKKPHEVNV
jgi:hypothetical protein